MVIMINDEKKSVDLICDTLELPIPNFKDIVDKLVVPFSLLNSTASYIYNPTDKQKDALKEIQEIVVTTIMEQIANNLPQKILSKQIKCNHAKQLTDYIEKNTRPGD